MNLSEKSGESKDYYVYRLIDPRTGHTFYVGKGTGDRVFQHAKAAIKFQNGEDKTSEKIAQINAIVNDGLNVIHIIHRSGMTQEEALEVEAALIDVYSGLTNIQSGIDSERGMMAAETWRKLQELDDYDEPDVNYILIKVRSTVLAENNNNLYDTTRKAWRAELKNAQQYKYVFSVVDGIVKKVYTVHDWYNSNIPNRIEFNGEECTEDWVNGIIGKKIPNQYRKKGAANPFMYKIGKYNVKNKRRKPKILNRVGVE